MNFSAKLITSATANAALFASLLVGFLGVSSTAVLAAENGLKLELSSPPVMVQVKRLIQRIQFEGSTDSLSADVARTAATALRSLARDQTLISQQSTSLPEKAVLKATLGYFEGVRLVRTLNELDGHSRFGLTEAQFLQMGLWLPTTVASLLQALDKLAIQNSKDPSFQFTTYDNHPNQLWVQSNPQTMMGVSLEQIGRAHV